MKKTFLRKKRNPFYKMADMSQRSPLSSLSKDTMNINNTMPFNSNRINSAYKQPESVVNNIVVEPETIIIQKDQHHYGKWMNFLFWFVIIAIIAWFLLFSLRPEIVLKHHNREHRDSDRNEHSDHEDHDNRHGEVDHVRVLVGAIVIALIAIFLIWIFQWGCGHGSL